MSLLPKRSAELSFIQFLVVLEETATQRGQYVTYEAEPFSGTLKKISLLLKALNMRKSGEAIYRDVTFLLCRDWTKINIITAHTKVYLKTLPKVRLKLTSVATTVLS